MKTVAIIQARMGSTRLPGKIMAELCGEPMLWHVVERTRRSQFIDQVVVATSVTSSDDVVHGFCDSKAIDCFRGSETDVLDRYYQAAKWTMADHIVRVTADCPLVCPREAGQVITHHLDSRADYTHNITVWGSEMPLGTGIEIFTWESLSISWHEGKKEHHREHVDEYVYEHPERFRCESVVAPPALRRPAYRLTVDTAEDLALILEIYGRLYRPGEIIELHDVVTLLDSEPELLKHNQHIVQKTA